MSKKYNGFDKDRRKFLLTATAVTGAVGISVAGIPFITSMKPSEKAKAAGVYKGRPTSIDYDKVKAMKAEGMGATAIARELGCTRGAIYKVLKA